MSHPNSICAISDPALWTKSLDLFYGSKQALFSIDLAMPKKQVTSLIGPSGCGKSTFLRCFNRMNDLIDGVRVQGSIKLQDTEINDPDLDVIHLRRRIGMVFQKPTPFPKSIFENVVYGLRIGGITQKSLLEETCELSLKQANLWDEVKDRLKDSALGLSGGQHQRLSIARAIAVKPSVILMDEPCSALDPRSTLKIEELILSLKDQYTIVIVTHNMQQASRVSDYTAFFLDGRVIEFAKTADLFTNPICKETEDYITGRFG